MDKEVKDLSEKVLALENDIQNKNKKIEDLTEKIAVIENKLSEKYIDEKLNEFEKHPVEKFEKILESYSNYMREACTSIDDIVVELGTVHKLRHPTRGYGGVSQKMTKDDRGGGPAKDDR